MRLFLRLVSLAFITSLLAGTAWPQSEPALIPRQAFFANPDKERCDVITLFLRQGGKLITIGVLIGLAGGAAISSLLAIALVDISQFDPLAFGVAAAFMIGVALLACWLPARRATKVDPLIALRCE